MAYFEFPHTRTYDTDLGWLIHAFKDISQKLDEYLENAVITFADPITWDITEQYTALTCVIDSDGTAYLSKQPVPAGVDISNTNYWLPIFNYDDNINELRDQIAYNARTSPTTTVDLAVGDLVFWNGLLYMVTVPMTAGSAFIVDTNITKYTVDEKFQGFADADAALSGRIDDEVADRDAADIALGGRIDQEILDRTDADDALSARIDSLDFTGVYIVPEDYGAAGDGTTDDTAALQRCFDLGKPVYLKNSYLITDTVRYTGPELYGNGQIIVGSLASDKSHAIRIQAESIQIVGLRVNCNNSACLGFWISANRDVYIRGVTVHNTQTTYYETNSGSVGIFIDSCSKAEISQCYIHDINRTTGIVNVHSSAGIVVYARNAIYIHDNLIEKVLSSISYYDCDGIYATYIDDTDKTTAVIENNKISDCTGRFIKSQTKYTVVRNNFCFFTISFVPNDRYFNCVSIQRGSFEIVNNYFNLGNNIHRGYSRCFSLEIYDTTPRTGIIKGNTVLSRTGGSYPDTLRNYLYIVSTDASNNYVDITIEDNILNGRTESCVGLSAAYAINGIIKIRHNRTNMYQVMECVGSYTNFDKVFVDCEYNDNTLYNQSTRLSSETCVFTMLKYRYNISLQEAINNYPISYNNLPIFEGYYRGAIQAMTNLPAGIARGDYLFMIKSPNVTEFKSFADTSSGYILN